MVKTGIYLDYIYKPTTLIKTNDKDNNTLKYGGRVLIHLQVLSRLSHHLVILVFD